jgi:hypothetical protein
MSSMQNCSTDHYATEYAEVRIDEHVMAQLCLTLHKNQRKRNFMPIGLRLTSLILLMLLLIGIVGAVPVLAEPVCDPPWARVTDDDRSRRASRSAPHLSSATSTASTRCMW